MPSSRRKYDNPTLSAVEFLFAVMHDSTLPIEARVEAAGKLLTTDTADLPGEREPAVIYRIEDYREAHNV
jgi:hypothetical protein